MKKLTVTVRKKIANTTNALRQKLSLLWGRITRHKTVPSDTGQKSYMKYRIEYHPNTDRLSIHLNKRLINTSIETFDHPYAKVTVYGSEGITHALNEAVLTSCINFRF